MKKLTGYAFLYRAFKYLKSKHKGFFNKWIIINIKIIISEEEKKKKRKQRYIQMYDRNQKKKREFNDFDNKRKL